MARARFIQSLTALLIAVILVCTWVLPASAAQGKQGLQGGWAIDDAGHVNFLHSVRSELPLMQQAGAGVVRLNLRLGACFKDWKTAGCATADAASALSIYDLVVNEAINTYHLKVVGLISNESWPGGAAQWTTNNAEVAWGTGDNAYIRAFATGAAGVLARHFVGRISIWEVWNEPNAWTANPSPGVYTGGSFIYPSNFAVLLKRSYAAIKAAQPGSTSTVVSGGLFGHDIGGVTLTVVTPDGARQTITKKGAVESNVDPLGAAATPATCTSRVPSGADYLCNTYRMGLLKAGWTAGAFPLDAIGQHLYIDQGGLTSASKIKAYLQDVRAAYVAFEGAATAKKIQMTEFGWLANPGATYPTAAANQAKNVQTAYSTFKSTSYVSRGDYFTAQDVPEGNIFYGLVQGDGTTYKPAFSTYQTAAAY
jgi:hypothetical protein